jgi:Putative restriction endonuclease
MVATPIKPTSPLPAPATAPPFRPAPAPEIAWVKPPDDFVLDDTPVENDGQPVIAGALRESLELAGKLPAEGLIASNFGLCLRIGDDLTLKAPDWLYVPQVNQPGLPRKSYTPNLEGTVPDIVMEFLSDTEGGEYSIRRTTPIGKWYFYEQLLQVPNYVIFEPDSGLLEIYRLESGRYNLEQPNVEGRHWFAALGLWLGTWRGFKESRDGYWLRWWDTEGQLLPWGIEQIEQERQRTEAAEQRAEQESQRAEQESQRAEQASQRADRLAALLRAQGIDPDAIA